MFRSVRKEEIKVLAVNSELATIRDFIGRVGEKNRFEDRVISALKLVVDEVCTNIIRHGYRDIKNGEILVRAIVRRLSFTIIIIDRGKSHDPRNTKDPDLHKYVSIGKRGGLGTFMVRKLIDDIQYNVTGRGNELRLTKFREAPEENAVERIWNQMNLRHKFSLFAAIGITLVAIVSYFYFQEENFQDNVSALVEKAYGINASFSHQAAILSNEIRQDNPLPVFLTAKAIQESNADLVYKAIVCDTGFVPLAMHPREYNWMNMRFNKAGFPERLTSQNQPYFHISMGQDSSYFAFYSSIVDSSINNEFLGYAVLVASESTFENLYTGSQLNLLLRILLGIVLGYGGAYVLIYFIMAPFQKLADWVRQVGRGQLDEDEIDIDARDELGEIAQAFNEMTTKFRESQQSLIERQRMSKELQVAQEIQQMLLPTDFPKVYGYDITSYYQAAKEVGGDLFDFVEVDEHSIGICVADVSGKGVPGSMVMTMIRTAIRMEARNNNSPADVLTRVNTFVTGDIKRGMFVTAFYIILDSKKRTISYASAGHNPMILFRGKSRETFYLNPAGFPIGITLPDPDLFGNKIKEEKIRLHPDDVLLAYTDGITEAMNPQRELFSEERLLEAVRKEGHLNVVDFVKKLQAHLLNFTNGYEQNDDITVVSIKESMEAEDLKLEAIINSIEKVDAKEMTITDACRDNGISTNTYYRYRKMFHLGGMSHLAIALGAQEDTKAEDDFMEKLSSSVKAKVEAFVSILEAVRDSDLSTSEACQIYELSKASFYRYKKIYLKGAFKYVREMIHGYTNFGVHHLSIEAKTKLYDIIAKHPKYGPERISKLLKDEKYGSVNISPRLIYEELRRAKLSNKAQRLRFVSRGGKRRLKPPGTPLLTLDGEVMVGFRLEEMNNDGKPGIAEISSGQSREKIISTVE
jgi:serine phosphatase RsbU (regulator of sigma subunit)/anti-sigma regulatory factor (Ser/Thr protein kinase)/ACT domain-containing protein